MTVQDGINIFKKVNSSLVKVLNFFAASALAAMMFLTFADVLLRYVFNSPIYGSAELIEFLMAIFIPFAIVYCAQNRNHISVDLIVENLSDSVKKVNNLIISLLMLILFVPITWQSFNYIVDELHSGLTSPVLYIPVYPFIGITAIAFLVLTLVLVEQFFETLVELGKQWTHSQ